MLAKRRELRILTATKFRLPDTFNYSAPLYIPIKFCDLKAKQFHRFVCSLVRLNLTLISEMKVSLMPMSEASGATKDLLPQPTNIQDLDVSPNQDLMSFTSPVVATRRSVRRSEF